MISVDGLSWERLWSYRAHFTGGLKRLLSEGRVEREARYRHLNTETGPGHASLGTGAPPRVTGIVANRWFEARPDGSLAQVYCTDQLGKDPITGDELTVPGPARLRVPTLGDRLLEKHPGSRVVALSGKDRGAILMAGKSPQHAVFWYDQEAGRFVSSSAYDRKSPAGSAVLQILNKLNHQKAAGQLPKRFGLSWRKLPPPISTGDAAPQPASASSMAMFQVPAVGLGFDHDLSRHADGYFAGIYYSPFLDELLADAALSVLEDTNLELGHQADPDLLLLSFSAQDTVSHQYGAESEENLDVLRRLDLQIGRLFAHLDRYFPSGKVLVALSSDHGFLPVPEAERKRDKSFHGGRLVTGSHILTTYLDRLNRYVSQQLCLDSDSRPLFGSEGWNVRYNAPAFAAMSTREGPCGPAGRTISSSDIDRVLPTALKALYEEELEGVLLASRQAEWDPKQPYVEFAKNAFDPERTGDAMLIPRPGVLMHWDPGRGSGHGSHHENDIHVPMIFWGAGIDAALSDAPTAPYDLAPTIGGLLGVALPDAIGRPLLGSR